VLLPASLLGIVLSTISNTVGSFVLEPCITIADALVFSCYRIEQWLPLQTHAPLRLSEICLSASILLLLASARLPPMHPFMISRKLRFVSSGLLLLCLSIIRMQSATPPAFTRITFVEVGQGDAALVELPDGQVWLIDGGGLPFVTPGTPHANTLAQSPARQALLPILRHRRIDHIDLAIVSHPHPDHYIGLQAVAQSMPIYELWSVHAETSKGPYNDWIEDMRKKGSLVRAPHLGHWQRSTHAALEVLWPRYSLHPQENLIRPAALDPVFSVNDNSLVVRLHVAGRSLLFSGDIEAEAEELLVQTLGSALQSDIVKVAHHGSRTSSTLEFAQKVHPSVAVISCGRANRFRFPAPEVEARWKGIAKHVFRTDKVGSIEVRIDAQGHMELHTEDAWDDPAGKDSR